MIELLYLFIGIVLGLFLAKSIGMIDNLIHNSERKLLRDWRSDLMSWESNLKSREMKANEIMSKISREESLLSNRKKMWRSSITTLVNDLKTANSKDELYGRINKALNSIEKQIKDESKP